MRVVVVSDLHMGSGVLDDFEPEMEQALVDFCQTRVAEEPSTELVINGDFLDFVQADPWQSPDFENVTPSGVPLCFTQKQSLTKLENIIGAHAAAFDALGKLLKSKNL